MNMDIQTVEAINTQATGLIRRSRKIRIITLFKHTREVSSISLVGDYALLCQLLKLRKENLCNEVNRWGVRTALNESKEFSAYEKREKTFILNQLMKYQRLCTAQIK